MLNRKAPKIRIQIGILSFSLFGLLFSLPAAPSVPPPILDSPSYLIMDPDTQTVIDGRNIHEIRAPASTTKIMTALLAIETIEADGGLDLRPVLISPNAEQEHGSGLGISAGELIPLGDLACATIVRSGNDGAIAIAEHIGGSVDGFCDLMNLRAAQLGMNDTHFVNPNGMPDDDHYSSAYDLAILAVEAMKHPEFRDWVSQTEVHFDTFGNRQDVTFESTNHLLDIFPFADGIKTGYTNLAGYCLVASATFRRKTLIAVVLGCERDCQWPDAIQLFDYAFTLYDPDYMEFRNLYEHGGIL